MINEETFASRLTSLREQKKVSAREMSLDLGQNGSYINRIENRAYGHFPRPSGPRSPARQGHIKRPVLRLAEPSFLRPANQCC